MAALYALAWGAGAFALLPALGALAPLWLLSLVALVAGAAGWLAWRTPTGLLRWDGQVWACVAPGGQARALGGVRLQIDFGSWVLLRWRVPPRRQALWACLHARDAGPAWHGMRVALVAHAARHGDGPAERRA